MRPQNGKLIADSAMDRSMAYCYDRGGGEYTRLVPVDLLPVDLESIPRRVNTDEGMIVLPVPRQPGADGQPADAQLERQRVVTVSFACLFSLSPLLSLPPFLLGWILRCCGR